jgi:hypothetical protein
MVASAGQEIRVKSTKRREAKKRQKQKVLEPRQKAWEESTVLDHVKKTWEAQVHGTRTTEEKTWEGRYQKQARSAFNTSDQSKVYNP